MEKVNPKYKSLSISSLIIAFIMLYTTIAPGIAHATLLFNKLDTLKPIGSMRFLHLEDAQENINPEDKDIVFDAASVDDKTLNPVPGGPDQPEVQSFTPIGTSDMVDPFSGDFSYNIPLLEVDGYPINIAYNAGITMDQEATWVGLGWNLNPGVVNRSMRGLPDDFNGEDEIVKEFNQKPDWTAGTSVGVDYELFSFDFNQEIDGADTSSSSVSLSIGASLGINYNNYNGFGADFSISPSFSIAGKGGSNLSSGLGISGSSTGGASLSPSLSFSKTKGYSGKGAESVTNGINIGSSFNSRGGVSNVSLSYSRSYNNTNKLRALDKKGEKKTKSVSRTSGGSSSFNTGMSTYTPSISFPMQSYGITGKFKLGPDAVGNDLTISF
ncbi:MAG: hypothetical protein COA33_012475 [Fluviicola sp.]|nr:hypothetical protein [Fluviicola sp.]